MNILAWLQNVNTRIDSVRQPRRFVYFMAAMALAIIPLQVGMHYGNKPSALFGLAVLTVIATVGAVRCRMIGGMHAKIGVVMIVALLVLAVDVLSS